MRNDKMVINLRLMKDKAQDTLEILSETYKRLEEDKDLTYFEYTLKKDKEDYLKNTFVYKIFINHSMNLACQQTAFVTILDEYNRVLVNSRDIYHGDNIINMFYYNSFGNTYEFYLSIQDDFDKDHKEYPIKAFRVNTLDINNLLVALFDEEGRCYNIKKEDFTGYTFEIII